MVIFNSQKLIVGNNFYFLQQENVNVKSFLYRPLLNRIIYLSPLSWLENKQAELLRLTLHEMSREKILHLEEKHVTKLIKYSCEFKISVNMMWWDYFSNSDVRSCKMVKCVCVCIEATTCLMWMFIHYCVTFMSKSKHISM